MSSSTVSGKNFSQPITTMEYMDVGAKAAVDAPVIPITLLQTAQQEPRRNADVELSNEEFAARINQERAEAAAQAEERVRREYEGKLEDLQASVAKAIEEFHVQRSDYFARVEAEVVRLALSIAAKILHREAQVDPMLVAALVKIALEKMREESSVTVRVSAGRAAAWRTYFAGHARLAQIQIQEDPELSHCDCVLETELGTAHLGLEQQLKEVEQGFFDLLAMRPETR